MATTLIETTNISELIKMYLKFPPPFSPRYDGFRLKKYANLNTKKEEIVNFLLENWKNPNYNNEELIKIIDIDENKDEQILEDIRNVLIDSVISAFYEKNRETPNMEINNTNAVQIINQFIIKNFENMVFKRTANYSTPYGFL
jgi:hypothetical protein